MKVELIQYNADAADIMIFTKQTRLNMVPGLLDEIKAWPNEKKLKELEYMANTIPSSWEFSDYTFLITGVSRAFTHQFVRTRQGSYAQQSMRVTDQSGFDYITGPTIGGDDESSLSGTVYHQLMSLIKEAYGILIEAGVSIEDARGILPTNICTNIVAKFNLRTLSELARSRTGGRTQSEYRDVVQAMCDEVLKVHPWAHMFLFPKGRDYFTELERIALRVKIFNYDLGQDMLKIIDKMRKE